MLISNLRRGRYLKAPLVLAIDVLVSLSASACVLLFTAVLSPEHYQAAGFVAVYLAGALACSAVSSYVTRLYRAVIRYATLRELGVLCEASLLKAVLLGVVLALLGDGAVRAGVLLTLLALDVLATVSALLTVRVLMVAVWNRCVSRRRREGDRKEQRVLVYGTGEKSTSVVSRLHNSPHYRVLGFLSRETEGDRNVLLGLPIYPFGTMDEVASLRRRLRVDGVLFAYHQDAREEKDRLVEYCREAGLKMYIAPTIDEMPDGKLLSKGIRRINVEDLLGREEIKISMEEIRRSVEGRTVMVTGAAGSIGSELCRQLAGLGVRELVMFDNAETPLHNVRLEFEDRYPELRFTPVIGDVRQEERLDYVFGKYRPEIVFHAAAYKHVPLMEENPCEAVLVNVVGTRNVAEKCIEYGAEKMVMISTDKAVNPTNIMGCTKRLAEIYVQSLGLALEKGEVRGVTRFVTTRFGNVLGSNGSVIPRFAEQIENGGPVTVTDPEIRRFFMTIPEACRLVLEAATMATGTQIFAFDMGTAVKISDLAKKMIHLAGYEVDRDIRIEYTGLRPGEKLYEEVLATKENTVPTCHERIFVAKVRNHDYAEACGVVSRLEELSRKVEIPEMVRLMKATVPEFKSKHSVFEQYDGEEQVSGVTGTESRGEQETAAEPDSGKEAA